jgi:hypothetical protein
VKCLDGLGIPFIGREDLEKVERVEEENDGWEVF